MTEPHEFPKKEVLRPENGRSGTVLVLGGGGAKGLAHLGVLTVLEEAKIKIDRVIGLSIGSLVGAHYALTGNAEATREKIVSYVKSEPFQASQALMSLAAANRNGENAEFRKSLLSRLRRYIKANVAFNQTILKRSILPQKPIDDALKAIVPAGDIAKTMIPLSIVALDLLTGQQVVLESGDIHQAVRGSSALPGIFPPVPHDGRLLCDIGVLCALPIRAALYYQPKLLIAVDLAPRLIERNSFNSALEVILRMQDVAAHLFKEHLGDLADVVIRPETSHIDWSDFTRVDDTVKAGEDATRAKLEVIIRRLAA
jgi:NTE family protein